MIGAMILVDCSDADAHPHSLWADQGIKLRREQTNPRALHRHMRSHGVIGRLVLVAPAGREEGSPQGSVRVVGREQEAPRSCVRKF
jgi:hypothetical protein